MTPTCYADLHLKRDWTEEGDSKGTHGKCVIVPAVGDIPMGVHFNPAARPPGENWDNAYVLHRNAASGATAWEYSVSVRFPSLADVANCEAFELDWQKNDGQNIFNLGWQFLFGSGLRLWNRAAGHWQPPVMPLPSTLAQCLPTRVTALFEHDGGNVFYRGISLNGVWSPLNVEYPAVFEPQNKYVNNAVQLDSKGKGQPISVETHECSVVGF